MGIAMVLLAAGCGREGAPITASEMTTVAVAGASETPEPTPPPTEPPTPSPTHSPTPEATPTCRNSTDAACGPFRWDPDPEPNEPLTVDVTFQPADPKVGEEVTFTVVAKDDAGTPHALHGEYGNGWGFASSASCAGPAEERYGPWAPPPKDHQDNTDTYKAPYEKAGTYTASFTYTTASCTSEEEQPYVSSGTGRVTVVVSE